MTIAELLVAVVATLKKEPCSFAIAGGLAANLYRQEIRVTEDIDFGILAGGDAIKIGRSIWNRFGIEGQVVTRKKISLTPTYNPGAKWMMVADRNGEHRVDFMLWQLDWVTMAVERAQQNVHPISRNDDAPFLTLEDVILAKAFAVHHAGPKQDPYKHMSDLQDILNHNEDSVDMHYLAARLEQCKVSLPKAMKGHLPRRFHVLTKSKEYGG